MRAAVDDGGVMTRITGTRYIERDNANDNKGGRLAIISGQKDKTYYDMSREG